MRYLKKQKRVALWKVLIADALLVGVILLTFAFFHHVLPRIVEQRKWEQEQLNTIQPSETLPPYTQTEPPEEQPTQEEETEPPTEPDNRTQWQIKFEQHFTDEVVLTANSYSSPEVSISIEKVVDKIGEHPITYYVADIYIASTENFKTYTANNTVIYYGEEEPVRMTKDTNAILAMNGDFITAQKKGFLVRNGTVYADSINNSICVLFPDGTMETYDRGTYQIADILAREPLQVWSFGPALLDENGKAKTKYETLSGVAGTHPRSGVGYYEPGHYCFVVVEGRQKQSVGLRLSDFAKIFEDLGCAAAYNLDGGASSVMLFDQEKVSKPSNNGRDLGDILYITDSYYHDGIPKQGD